MRNTTAIGHAFPSSKKRGVFACLVLFCICLLGPPMLGQASSGSVTGIVSDSSGAVLPKAVVRLTNVDTNFKRELSTDGAGLFRASDLLPGRYQVDATVPGFATERRTGVLVSIGQVVTLNFSLKASSVDQVVSVQSSSSGEVDSTTSTVGEIIGEREVQDLPLNGRDFSSLIQLAPGAVALPSNGISLDEYDINGGRPEGNLVLIDGIDVLPATLENILLRPNLEGIAEFQVQTSNFSSEFGRSVGGVINSHIKSGTNQYHGTLFEYFRNDVLDTIPEFTIGNPPGTPPKNAPLRYNQFGGSIGGPVFKDKLFFFGDYQGTRNLSSGPFRTNIPTPAETTPAGGFYDFSAICTAGFTAGVCNDPTQQIYNPFNSPRTPFANNKIPVALADPTVALMFSYLPKPNFVCNNVSQCGSANFAATQHNSNLQDGVDLRLDYHPTEKDQLGVSFIIANASTASPSLFGPNLNSGGLTSFGSEQYRMGALTYTHIFTPQLSNEFVFGLPTQTNDGPVSEGMQYIPSLAGVGGLNTSASDPQTTGFPEIIDASTGTTFGAGAGGPFVAHTNTPQFADNLTWIKGRHAFKTGVLFRAREYNIFQSIFPRGLFITTAFETANGGLQGGNGFASDLIGDPLETIIDLNFKESGQRIKEGGAYFQDDFKVNKQLTLNLGMRWDFFGPATDVHNRLSNLNLTTKKLFFPGNGVSASTINSNYLDFGPHVGFAFAPTANGNTVIRGGFAISYTPLQVQAAASTLDYNPPYTYEAVAVDAGNLFGPPGNTLVSDGLPIQMSADPTVVPTGASVTYIPKYQPTPYTEQFSIGLEQKIPKNIGLFGVTYVGTNGIHLAGYQNLNQYAPGTSVAASPISPNIGEVNGLLNNEQSNYNSLQTKFDRNFTAGLAVTASYTYSRSIDDGSSTTSANANSSNYPQNSFDLAAERGPSDFQPHASHHYQLCV